jgi:DNA-binding NarL/FixJ family response regulator
MNQMRTPVEAWRRQSAAQAAMPSDVGCEQELPPTKPCTKQPIRILLADDHPLVRKGLSSYLSNYRQVSIIGEASDGQEALRKAKELAPDVVLMDIEMPRMNGLTAADTLRKENPKIKVLMLSMHSDSDNVMRILQSGARGLVLKQAPTDDLINAIQSIDSGGTFFSPDVARMAINQYVRGGGDGPQTSQVSNREREVLIAIAQGLSTKEVACRLEVGVRTIRNHRKRIMRKLNIYSVAGLTKFAVAKGLVPLQKDPQPKP